MKNVALLISILLLLSACQNSTPVVEQIVDTQAAKSASPVAVTAVVETEPTLRDGANAAAILLNESDTERSLILGASGEGGIEVYTLDGKRLNADDSRLVSVLDVHYNFPLGGESVSLIVAYDTATSELVSYTLNPLDNTLQQVSTGSMMVEAEIEGLCLYHSPLSDKFYVFAAGGGYLQQWELFDQSSAVAGRLIRTMPVGLGAAQCVVSDLTSTLYYSQETVGVWRMNPEPESEAEAIPVDIAAPLGTFSGDVKGLGLVEYADGSGYLLVSDADVSLIQAYELGDFTHVATISVVAGAVDGVEEAEGLVASSMHFSDAFPAGLVVVSDDDNEEENTNFKLISWESIATAAGLNTGTANDPRVRVPYNVITTSPSAETQPVSVYGDAADDPMIWVHPTQPELSLLMGTQKKLGIKVYDLQGNLVQTLADGRINNIDGRYNFPLGGKYLDILVGSNRSTDSINIYAIDKDSRMLFDIADGVIPTGMDDPYGLCMYRSAKTGNYFVIINDTDGVVKQWLLLDNGNQKVGVKLVREFKLDSQTEGCVADDETGYLYIGEEDVGIWKYSAEPDGGEDRTQVDSVADGNLTDDVEGLSIYFGPDGAGYLIASNQGADNYAVYERAGDNKFLGLFHLVADEESGIDGVSETDGLDVTSANLGPTFPNGLLIVQDGRNITPDDRQNFKLVPWERVAEAMGLEIYSGYDPRASSSK